MTPQIVQGILPSAFTRTVFLNMQLEITPFVFDSPSSSRARTTHGLKLTAKRYVWRSSADNHDGLTLLFAHCIGAREFPCSVYIASELKGVADKEQWEHVSNA